MKRSSSGSGSLRLTVVATGIAALVAATGTARVAHAQTDCPPGSTQKSESGFTWCAPSVCDTDAQCGGGEVCRPIPLCVQVGKVDPKGAGMADAGERLVATQRCGADKACPNTTVCSDKSRCISRDKADRLGLLAAAAPGGSASAGADSATPSAEPAKKSCGCHVPGARSGEPLALALATLGAVVIAARRRRRKSSR